MADVQTIRAKVAELELPLSIALGNERLFHSSIRPELRLTYEICGYATAVLQVMLRSRGISTERGLQRIDFRSSSAPDVRINHVVLFHNGVTIDPTFTQTYEHVGLTGWLAEKDPDTEQYFPDSKIAVFANDNPGLYVAADAKTQQFLSIRPGMLRRRQQLYSAGLEPARDYVGFGQKPAFADSFPRDIFAYFATLWQKDAYKPFSIEDNSEHFQETVIECVAIAEDVSSKVA